MIYTIAIYVYIRIIYCYIHTYMDYKYTLYKALPRLLGSARLQITNRHRVFSLSALFTMGRAEGGCPDRMCEGVGHRAHIA